jgi:hypothetical protein
MDPGSADDSGAWPPRRKANLEPAGQSECRRFHDDGRLSRRGLRRRREDGSGAALPRAGGTPLPGHPGEILGTRVVERPDSGEAQIRVTEDAPADRSGDVGERKRGESFPSPV